MLRFPAWKIVSILAMTAFALLLIVPSLLGPDHREAVISHLPKWMPARAIVLGLDLQGGSHVLLGGACNCASPIRASVRESCRNLSNWRPPPAAAFPTLLARRPST